MLGNAQLIIAKNYDPFMLLGSHVYTDPDQYVLGIFSKKRIPELALDIKKSLLCSMMALDSLFSRGSEVQEECDSVIQFNEMDKKKPKEAEANIVKVGDENSLLRGQVESLTLVLKESYKLAEDQEADIIKVVKVNITLLSKVDSLVVEHNCSAHNLEAERKGQKEYYEGLEESLILGIIALGNCLY